MGGTIGRIGEIHATRNRANYKRSYGGGRAGSGSRRSPPLIDHKYEQEYGRSIRSDIQRGAYISYTDKETLSTFYRLIESGTTSEVIWNLRIHPKLRPLARRYWTPKAPHIGLMRLVRDLIPLGLGGLRDESLYQKDSWLIPGDFSSNRESIPRVESPELDEQTQQDTSNTSSSSQRGYYSHTQGSRYSYVRNYRRAKQTFRYKTPVLTRGYQLRPPFSGVEVDPRGRYRYRPRTPRDEDLPKFADFNNTPCFEWRYVRTKKGWKKTRVPCSQAKTRRNRIQTRSKYGRRQPSLRR